MAERTASFGIEIADETGPGVKSSTSNLEKLRSELDSETYAISQMTRAMRLMQGGTAVNVVQFKALKQQIADAKIRTAGLATQIVAAGGDFRKKFTPETKAATSGLESLANSLLATSAPVSSATVRATSFAKSLGAAGVAGGAVLLAAAMVAVVGAIGLATAAMAKFGLANADAYRSEVLNLEALVKIPSWWGFAAGKASQLLSVTNAMSQAWGVSRQQVGQFTQSLYLAGYRGNMLKNAVEATTVATAAFGGNTELANRYLAAMSWQFGLLGKGADGFAAKVKRDLGDIAIRQSLGFSKQMVMLRQNLGLLWSGVRIEPFLKSLNMVLSLFSETTVSGKLMKSIIGSIFDPIFAGAGGAGLAIKHMIQDSIYWVLRAQGAWIDLQIWVAKTFNYRGDLGLTIAVWSLKAALVAATVIGASLAAVLLVVVANVAVLTLPFIVLGYVIYKSVKAILEFSSRLRAEGKSWSQIGVAMVQGIASGIVSGAGTLWKAIAGLADGAVTKFKEVLGIQSPSRVFRAQASFVPAGMVMGIRAGIPDVHAAISDAAYVPPTSATMSVGASYATPMLTSMASSGGGASTAPQAPSQTTNHFHFTVEASTNQGLQNIRRILEQILQGANVEVGAG